VDIAWGPGFILAWGSLLFLYPFSAKALWMFVMIAVWGIRLGIHILVRNLGKPEDFRYANWRKEWGRKEAIIAFFKIFMLQGSVMFALSMIYISTFWVNKSELTMVNIAGGIIFSAGWLIESIADFQLGLFLKTRKDKDSILTKGLWKYSRHPNYFGESLIWWGLWLFSFNETFQLIFILLPLGMTLLLRYGSGVPMLEKKYRNKVQFREYAEKTPVFVPFIGKRGLG
jgi:steroid 5-alpha reductase family enzyme